MKLTIFSLASCCAIASVACGGPETRGNVTVWRSGSDVSQVRVTKGGPATNDPGYLPAPRPAVSNLNPMTDSLPPPAEPVHAHGATRLHIETTPAIQQAAINEWSARYPDAARDLRDWVKKYPKAAELMFQWDLAAPERTEVLTKWAVTHRFESVDAFLLGRSDWTTLEAILQRDHKQAVEEYLSWARRGPAAALELVEHAHGLAWAGANLYQTELAAARR